jgi:tRNA(Ile)-lysidine synthase
LPLEPALELVARFAERLDRMAPPGGRLGVAVSGGADSLALLLLAAAARPGAVEAASVDHALRPESAAEAAMVAKLCEQIGVPHSTLTAQWGVAPQSAIQERARAERYRLLGNWAGERSLAALATAHHLDDQAETLLMRLARGAGVNGLAAIRPVAPIPGGKGRLVRPLLAWSRAELAEICAAAGVIPVRDPGNHDQRFERVRVRRALAQIPWLAPRALARSAAHLASADIALEWAAAREWELSVSRKGREIAYRPGSAPHEIRRRIITRAIAMSATEGDRAAFRGAEIDRLMAQLEAGGTATLRGVVCSGGEVWTFAPAPKRRLH